MPDKTIKQILMERDGLSEKDAERTIDNCRDELLDRLSLGQLPFDICEEWFGLEPDYIDEILPF
jgi:hypothetical protein